MSLQIVEIAKIGKTFGFKGSLKLRFLGSFKELKQVKNIFFNHVSTKHEWQLLDSNSYSITDSSFKFREINTINDAICMIHGILGIAKEDLPSRNDDEFYYRDLIGLEVFSIYGEPFGKIVDIISTAANEILVCRSGVQEYLIPFVKSYVDSVGANVIVTWKKSYTINDH